MHYTTPTSITEAVYLVILSYIQHFEMTAKVKVMGCAMLYLLVRLLYLFLQHALILRPCLLILFNCYFKSYDIFNIQYSYLFDSKGVSYLMKLQLKH